MTDSTMSNNSPSLTLERPGSVAEMRAQVEQSRLALLEAIGRPSDITILRSWGNLGDILIFAGMRALLRHLPYREYDIRFIDRVPPGDLAIISGGGSWCKPFHALPAFLPLAEASFRRVIVFPSSFDIEEPSVREALSQTRAAVFARERQSYEQIAPLCDARLAHDSALFFDFSAYNSGAASGILHAFREDAEATGALLPDDNRDISQECSSLDEWLWTISRHALIRTDRAHVMIAAAMLGKRIEFRPSSYHKVSALIDYCIPKELIFPLTEGHDWSRAPGIKPAQQEIVPDEPAPVVDVARDAERDHLEYAIQELQNEMAALRASWSWRITLPLRLLGSVALAIKAALARLVPGSTHASD